MQRETVETVVVVHLSQREVIKIHLSFTSSHPLHTQLDE